MAIGKGRKLTGDEREANRRLAGAANKLADQMEKAGDKDTAASARAQADRATRRADTGRAGKWRGR